MPEQLGEDRCTLRPAGWAEASANPATNYDVAPDGRFVMIRTAGSTEESSGPAQINVVLNWFEELKRLMPTN